MSPQLMGVVYAFVGFIIALYVLSVVYVFIDARRRGASAYVAWGIIALIPFVGLIAYLVLRRTLTRPTARSRSWTWPCASASLLSTAPARSAARPSRRTSSSARCAIPRFATSAPAAIARSMRTGRSARTAELASSNASIAGPAASHGHRASRATATRHGHAAHHARPAAPPPHDEACVENRPPCH